MTGHAVVPRVAEVRQTSRAADVRVDGFTPDKAAAGGRIVVALTVRAGNQPGEIRSRVVLADPNSSAQLGTIEVVGKVVPGADPNARTGNHAPAATDDRLRALEVESATLAKQRADLMDRIKAIQDEMEKLKTMEAELRDRAAKLDDLLRSTRTPPPAPKRP